MNTVFFSYREVCLRPSVRHIYLASRHAALDGIPCALRLDLVL